MEGRAREMKALGTRPGIWIRYLSDSERQLSGALEACRLRRDPTFLDPSHPDVLAQVTRDTQRIVQWGFELIKHDYSTFDIFGRWGFQARGALTDDGWSFYDRSRTSAEIVMRFYRTIQEAAGEAVVLGCNCIGHLCAGIHQLNRTGDDTSGVSWERTKTMGVNTLAFRMMQNHTFFSADADCVGHTGQIPWELNRKWLRLLARSGSPLFVSCNPGMLSHSQKEELRQAFLAASEQRDRLVPVDWMEQTIPSKWNLNGRILEIDWD